MLVVTAKHVPHGSLGVVARRAMLAAKLPCREWKQLKEIEVAGCLCDFEGEVREGSTPDGYGRCWWKSEDCWYRGRLQNGRLHGMYLRMHASSQPHAAFLGWGMSHIHTHTQTQTRAVLVS